MALSELREPESRNLLRDSIAEAIRRDFVDSADASPGTAIPGIRELARIYSVSTGTIQGAIAILQSQDAIKAKTRSGCYVNSAPSRSSAFDLVGFVFNTRSQLSISLLAGIDRCCHEYGLGVMAATAGHDTASERAQVRRAIDAGCKGLVIYPLARTGCVGCPDYLETERFEVPMVLIDLGLASHPYSQVLFDNYRVGYDMARYLLNRGHERIAFAGMCAATSRLPWRSLADRYRGVVQAIRGAGGEYDEAAAIVPSRLIVPIDHEWGELWLSAWKRSPIRPTALIAPEDDAAADLIRTAQGMGIDVPGDLEICGFDDTMARSSVGFPFATTRADWEQAGRVAVDLLLQHVRGELSSPMTYLLPVSLVTP